MTRNLAIWLVVEQLIRYDRNFKGFPEEKIDCSDFTTNVGPAYTGSGQAQIIGLPKPENITYLPGYDVKCNYQQSISDVHIWNGCTDHLEVELRTREEEIESLIKEAIQ